MNAPRRRRIASLTGALVVSLALVSGCTGQRAPDSYTGGVRNNFIRGCTEISEQDGTLGSASSAREYCTCVYDIVEEDVPFDTFKRITDEQTESGGGPLPASFQRAYDSCEVPEGGSSTTTTTTEG